MTESRKKSKPRLGMRPGELAHLNQGNLEDVVDTLTAAVERHAEQVRATGDVPPAATIEMPGYLASWLLRACARAARHADDPFGVKALTRANCDTSVWKKADIAREIKALRDAGMSRHDALAKIGQRHSIDGAPGGKLDKLFSDLEPFI